MKWNQEEIQENSIDSKNIYPLIVSEKKGWKKKKDTKTFKYFIRSLSACRQRSIAIENNNKSQFYQITIVPSLFFCCLLVVELCVEDELVKRSL